MSTYPSTSRRVLVTADPRLTRLMQREPTRCATLSEYSAATGIDTGRVVDLFSEPVADGVLAFEPVGTEVFVHTAPSGRPAPRHLPEVAANLWERLRTGRTSQQAYDLWRLVRALELAGWVTETNTARIGFELGPLPEIPAVAITIDTRLAPVVFHPTPEQAADPAGPLGILAEAGSAVVALTCDSGALDDMVTAVRSYHRHSAAPSVVVLEAPRYNPVPVTASDVSVAPRSVSQITLRADHVE